MRRTNVLKSEKLIADNSFVGESLENKMFRVINNKEAVEAVSPIIYTERKDGVRPEFDIRTDIWETAQKSMAYLAKKRIEKRDQSIAEKQKQVDKQAE